MRYSISNYIHCIIKSRLIGCKTVIDMGGKGKMENRGFQITNANIKYGIDATNLPFEKNTFHASVSIAVLEHVGGEDKQIKFIDESIRVARKRVLHWIPIDEKVEIFLKIKGHIHPSITPSKKILDYLNKKGFKIIDNITIREHLINLTMLYPKLACQELYDYAYKNKNKLYGILLELNKL